MLVGVRAGEATLFLNGRRHHGTKDDVLVVAGQQTDIGTVVVQGGRYRRLRILVREKPPEPLPNAAVSVQPDAWPVSVETVWTNDEGECTVFVPEGAFDVTAKQRRSRAWSRCRPVRPKGSFERFVVKPAAAARVRVIDASGRDIPEAEVAVFATNQVEGANVRIGWLTGDRRDRNGFFVFHKIPLGTPVEFVASAPDYAPAVHACSVPTPEEGLHLRLQKRLSVEVTTVDHTNAPLGGVKVSVVFQPPFPAGTRVPDGEHWYRLTKYKPVFVGKTDENANLVVPGLWQGRMRFAAEFPGYTQSVAAPVELRPGMRVVIKMQHLAHLDGKLLLDGAAPTRRFVIQAIPEDQFEKGVESNPFLDRNRTITAADGSFSFHDLYAGKWQLVLAAPTNPTGKNVGSVWPEGASDFAFPKAGLRVYHVMNVKRAKSKRELRGRVQLVGRPSDAPLYVGMRLVRSEIVPPPRPGSMSRKAYAAWAEQYRRMRRQRRGRPGVRMEERFSRTLAKVPVASGEEFRLPINRPGVYRISLEAVFGGRSQVLQSRDVEFKPDAKTGPPPLDFTVSTGDARLFLVNRAGTPLGHRVLELRQEMPKSVSRRRGATLRVCSDKDGTIYLAGIPAGSYVLENAYKGRSAEKARFIVPMGTLEQRYLELR